MIIIIEYQNNIHYLFSSIRPEGLNFYYFGIEGSVSEPGLISG